MGYVNLLAGETSISEVLEVNENEQARIVPNDPDRVGGADYYNQVEKVGALINNLIDVLPDMSFDDLMADARSAFNFVTSAPDMLESIQQKFAEFMSSEPDMTQDYKNDQLTLGG